MKNPDRHRFVIVRLDSLRSVAAQRPAGYVDEVLAAGVQRDEFHVLITRPAYDVLRAKYSPPAIIKPDGIELAARRMRADQQGWDGSKLWAMLHTASAPDPSLIQQVTRLIPCGSCKSHWLQMLQRTPPVFTPLPAWRAWVTDRHSEVNLRLGRRPWSYAESDARWGKP